MKKIHDHERILGETLLKLLIKIGVVREDACPTGPELVATAEDYINAVSQQVVAVDEKKIWLCDCGRKHIGVYDGFTCICGNVFRTD